MTSLTPYVTRWDFDTDPAPQSRVNATQLDLVQGDVAARFNAVQAILDTIIRGDDTLADGIIRLRNLHTEVAALLGSLGGWQPKLQVAVATLANITLSGEQSIDGVTTSASRVLVKDQTTPSQNGIYLSGAGAWTRATDADTAAELGLAAVTVVAGSINGASSWVLTQAAASITLETTPLTWAKFGGTGGILPHGQGGTQALAPKDWATASRLMARVVATANVTPSAPGATIDGVALTSGDRVLLTGQTTGSQNGLWSWNGAASAMTRTNDYPTLSSTHAFADATVFVKEGTVNSGTTWRLTTTGTITIDTTSTAWSAVVSNGSSVNVLATGTVTKRNLADRFADVLNVKDFGAKGDGVTDDTVPINAAMVAAAILGAAVLFPPGTYIQTNRITVLSETKILGYGATLKAGAAMDASLSQIWIQGRTRVRIEGIKLDGNRTSRSGSNSEAGIYLTQCTRCSIENVHIVNSTWDGIKIAYGNGADASTRSSFCTFRNVSVDGSYRNGWTINGAYDCSWYDCSGLNTVGSSPEAGFDVEADNTVIRNERCRFYNIVTTGNHGEGFTFASFNFDCMVSGLNSANNTSYGIGAYEIDPRCYHLTLSGNGSGPYGGFAQDEITVDHGALRNLLFNGEFLVWQRGASIVGSAGQYTADRWKYLSSAAFTVSRQAQTPGQTTIPGEPPYFLRVAQTAATPSTYLTQYIEDVVRASGESCVVSFWAKRDSAATIDVFIQQNFGGGGSTAVSSAHQSIAVTTSWQYFTLVFAVPSITGKTIGTDSNLQLAINDNTNATFVFDISSVQMEIGRRPSPFAKLPFAMEIERCQRYYTKTFDYATTPARAAGVTGALACTQSVGAGVAQFVANWRFPTSMRKTPNTTLSNTSAVNRDVRDSTAASDCSGTLVQNASSEGLSISTITAGASGHLLLIHCEADAEF